MDPSDSLRYHRAPKKRFKKVYIEITNVCNKNCSFCAGTKRPPAFLSLEGFSHVISQVEPYTNHIYLHLMGEPLLHPELAEILKMCEKNGFWVNLTTNGSLLGHQSHLLLNTPALRKVSVSLHSFEEKGDEQLEYYRQCLAFALAASEKDMICELRLWNLGSGAEEGNTVFLCLAEKVFGRKLNPEMLTKSDRNGIRMAQTVFIGPADRFEWPSMENPPIHQHLFCYGLRDQIGVLTDGKVVPCCLDHEGDLVLGNLFEQPLNEILNSPRALAILDGFSRRIPVEPLCKRCGYAKNIRPR